MILDEKAKLILLQNLLNRAVDVEIADAQQEGRAVEIEKIEKRLNEISALAGKKIKSI